MRSFVWHDTLCLRLSRIYIVLLKLPMIVLNSGTSLSKSPISGIES